MARKLGVSVRTGRHGVTPALRCGARRVLVNAYGFGGNNASVVLAAADGLPSVGGSDR